MLRVNNLVGFGGSRPRLLDSITSSAAYGVRRLRTRYIGAILRVRRSSDNAEIDVGFDPAGNLNTTLLLSHCGSNSGFVTTWYDQSGNGRNLTQSTNGAQPRIVNAGVIDTLGGVPTLFCDATDDSLAATSWGVISQPFTRNAVIKTGSSNSGFPSVIGNSDGLSGRAVILIETNFATIGTYAGNNGPRLPVTTNERLIFTARFDGSSTNFAKNGTITSNGWAGSDPFSGLFINGSGEAPITYPGVSYQEVIIFESSISEAERQFVERNQGSYYGITVA